MSYAALSGLPQVRYTVPRRRELERTGELSGVSLDVLLSALGVDGKAMVAAVSRTVMKGTTRPIIERASPVSRPADRREGTGAVEAGPGWGEVHALRDFCTCFKPAFHVLAHKDMAQVPYGVTGLKLYPEKATVLKEMQPPRWRRAGDGGVPHRDAELPAMPSGWKHRRRQIAL